MKKKISFLPYAREAAKIADDKKAEDVVLLNVVRLTPIADYFVIATVHSAPQMRAVLDAIEEKLKEKGLQHPLHRDGRTSSSWAVLDFGGLIVHVMTPQARAFYDLDKMWAEAKKVK